MKKFLCLTVLFSFLLSCRQEIQIKDSYADVKLKFENPPMEYRSMPLWVWNNKMTNQVIEEQLADFKDKGIGGVFVHPRPGLITPYLSEEWFMLFKHAVEVGKKLGMQVWIYDENSYPSGFAGGHVPAQMPESAGKMIREIKLEQIPDTNLDVLVVFSREGDVFKDITTEYKTLGKTKGNYYVYHFIQSNPSPWHGGFTYVDIMQRKVTEKFLEVTLDAYKKIIGEEFGKTVPGSFQDEAQVSPVWSSLIVNYTPALFEEFKKKWNYDLKSKLPMLYESAGDYKTVRYHFYRTILDLFIEGWAIPYSEYCNKNNLIFTGHYWEHEWPVPRIGPDNMAMEAYNGMPGIDILFNQFGNGWGGQFGLDRSVKEVRSVANQLGQRRIMSETYGGAGWDITFADQRRIADWEFVLGINFINQHLQHATLVGARKDDYPQSFSYHEPWWKNYKIMGDYLGRMSAVTSMGEQINNILIIEPTTSGWLKYNAEIYVNPDPALTSEPVKMARQFHQFIRKLETAQVEYDLGSERIIRDHGSVKDGKFIVGKRSYSMVVLPPFMECVDSSTYKLLNELMKQKGNVLCYQIPTMIEGYPTDGVSKMAQQYPKQWINESDSANISVMIAETKKAIDFANMSKSGILYHHRRMLKDARLLLLVNSHDSISSSGEFTLEGKSVECWDAMSGEIKPYPFSRKEKQVNASYAIPPKGSLLLCITDNECAEVRSQETTDKVLSASDSISISRKMPNILTIDYCDLKIGKKTGKDLYYYDAMVEAFKAYNWDYNPWDHAVQYKTDIIDKDTFSKGTGFEAMYHFVLNKDADFKSLQAVVERPEIFKVSVNGNPVQPVEGKWFFDKDFALYNICDLVKEGDNILSVKVDPFTLHAEIQPVYILGNFSLAAAKRSFVIGKDSSVMLGSWNVQGMPFYPYDVEYQLSYKTENTTAARYIVQLGSWNGTVVSVQVNGHAAGCILSPPYELDITRYIEPDVNKITVSVTGSLKNTFGPHHITPNPGIVSPWSFRNGYLRNEKKGFYPSGSDYWILPYGLNEPFKLITRVNK